MSNFAFLAAEFPAVHEAAVEAERQAGVSPTAAAFFAGKAVEVAVKWAFRSDPNLKLPDGQISATLMDLNVESYFSVFPKYSLAVSPKSPAHPSPSCPTEGRIRIVRDAGRDAVDAAASGVKRDGRAGPQGSVSDQTAR
jgi:hypothetical protein